MKRLLASSFFILLFWAFFVPTFEFPDEQAHFATVSMLSEQGKMPSGQQADVSLELETTEKLLGTYRDDRGINKLTYHPEYKIDYSNDLYGIDEQKILDNNNARSRSTYRIKEAARYPFLYYAYESIFYSLVSNNSIFIRLFLTRIGSVLLGVVNVWVAVKIGEELFNKKKDAILLGSLVALQPMMTFVMSGVNSDVLHNLLFSFIILFLIRFIKYDFVGDVAFYLGLFIGLDFLTKPQAYIAIPLIIVAFLIRVIQKKQVKSSIRSMLLLGVVAIILGFATQKGNFIRFIKTGTIPYLGSIKIHPDAPTFIEHAKYSLNRLVKQNIVWYWGVFKWLGVVLPRIFWQIANRIVGFSVIGLIVGIIRKKFKKETIYQILLLSVISISYVLIIFWHDWRVVLESNRKIGIQARYYLPTFTAHMALLIFGITGFFKKKKYNNIIRKILIVFFVSLQLAGIYTIAKSYYDISSINTLFIQASQYKPIFAKGYVWIIWVTTYLISLGNILYINLKNQEFNSNS